MLRSLEIQNFKGIKQGKIEDLAQVNILVGRNNSGKSTILDALVLLRAPVIGQDYLNRLGIEQILTRRVDRGRGNVAYDELWFRMATGDPLTLRAALGTEVTFTEQWKSRGNTNRPEASVELRQASDGAMLHKWVSSGDSGTARNYRNTNMWPLIKSQANEVVATFLSLIHILEPNLIHQEFDEGLWYELVRDRKDKKVIGILNDIYQTDIESLNFSLFPPPNRRLVAARAATSVAVDWLGDGFRYAVNILALGVLLQGTALLVEELETHQHPESLRKLTQALFELAKEQDLQLFLTTHSLELIDYAMEAAQERGIDLKLHHLSLDKEGTLRVTSMSQPDAKLLLDIGHDPRMHYKYIGTN
jgi:hypothetical protein